VNGDPCCPESFSAVPGWDAATGLGSPNFQVLSNLVINPDTSFPSIGAYPNGDTGSSPNDMKEDELEGLAIAALSMSIVSCFVAFFAMWSLYEAKSTHRRQKGINAAAYASLDVPFLDADLDR